LGKRGVEGVDEGGAVVVAGGFAGGEEDARVGRRGDEIEFTALVAADGVVPGWRKMSCVEFRVASLELRAKMGGW
jgi:hypothetical protein